MHWYTPPYLVDLVDIVAGPSCEPAIVTWAADLVARFRREYAEARARICAG